MKISIVIPTHNGEKFLQKAVGSVLAQTVSDWELVILDDGSTDGTAELADAFARDHPQIRSVHQRNSGVGDARNRGLAETSPETEGVIFLDHDDIWERDALELLAAALTAQPLAAAAHGLARVIDAEGEPVDPGELEMRGRSRWGIQGYRLVSWPLDAPTTLEVLAYKNCIYTPGQTLIRRAALRVVGGFDASLSPADDWDLWLRLSQRSHLIFLDRVLLNWRVHNSNGSLQKQTIFAQQARVRSKLLSTASLTQEQLQVVRVANAFWARQVASMHLGRARELLAAGEYRRTAPHLGEALHCLASGLRNAPATAPVFWPSLNELYRSVRKRPSDIQEHLGTLRDLARRCRHVTEFGTRSGISTIALLAARPSVLVTYDRERFPEVSLLERTARDAGRTRFLFRHADVLDVEIEQTDLLFIDTWHVYDQLKQELALHASKVRLYLVFHDTTTYGQKGEAPGSLGLWPAIEEFLHDNPQWTLSARFEHNNGLTILTQRGAAAPAPAMRAPTLPAASR